jgi:8-oxo-dGTP pyrophosphatase MutT (NUDIX family)
MNRTLLLQELDAYLPYDETEREMLRRLREFVQENESCFSAANPAGHITGGAWILDASRRFVLLTHHRKLDKWLHLGGHGEGERDALQIALREAWEESGLEVRAVREALFDLDVHPIPAYLDRPAHFHYDLRFAFEASRDVAFTVSSESKALAWVELTRIREWTREPSILRMTAKSRFLV